MASDAYGYQLADGTYAIEGFAFRLRGKDGELVVKPSRLLGPPVLPVDQNWAATRWPCRPGGVATSRCRER